MPAFWARRVLAALPCVREEDEALGTGAEARAPQDGAAGLGHHVAREQGSHHVARAIAALAGSRRRVREQPGGQARPAEVVGVGAAGTAGEGTRLTRAVQGATEDAGAEWALCVGGGDGAKKKGKCKGTQQDM